MPAAVLAVLAAPFGLDWLLFQIAGLGMGYIIAVAEFVAGLGGAVTGVPAGPSASLALILIGGTMGVLLIGRVRWAALAPAAVGLLLWAGHDRPDVMIADNGRLFGILTPAGRILSSERGGGYAAESWLTEDGDLASQAEAWARGRLERRRHRIEAEVPGIGTIVYVGTKDSAGAAALCAQQEDELIFYGDPKLGHEGLMNATGRLTVSLGDWSEPGRGYLSIVEATRKLNEHGHYGPYAVVLSPRLYSMLHRIFEKTGVLEIETIRQLAVDGVFQSNRLRGNTGVVISTGRENLDLAVAMDMSTAYLGAERMNHPFRVLEALLLRIKHPDAICTLEGAPAAPAPAGHPGCR